MYSVLQRCMSFRLVLEEGATISYGARELGVLKIVYRIERFLEARECLSQMHGGNYVPLGEN